MHDDLQQSGRSLLEIKYAALSQLCALNQKKENPYKKGKAEDIICPCFESTTVHRHPWVGSV